MTKNVLLVGLNYTGIEIPDTKIEVLGLCLPKVAPDKAAFALYEYDVIIINPASYSHFLFGSASKYSESNNELWDLKAENNNYDLDSAFDQADRTEELTAAIRQGTRVIWLIGRQKHIMFFGLRSIYSGYANQTAKKLIESAILHEKKSRRLSLKTEVEQFRSYYEQLQNDGWSLCISDFNEKLESFAESPKGYSLGGRVSVCSSVAWMLTPPTTQDSANELVRAAIEVEAIDVSRATYEGIFLSHTSADKPFVRELKKRLEAHGVKNVWLDEAEIMLGDSLTKKIDEGLKKSKYIGVVLSTKSIKSAWVERELESAINREISTGEVIILPLLYEKCDLPSFLVGKMYADFTSPSEFNESINKILRRLKTK
ncbi:MAG: toll/interleukin-1 receptor domain-containing protein [Chlorobiaceae bacterium]